MVEKLGLKSNPFEHYTAETEPHIAEYAVRPPYLQAIVARALARTPFILFGDRGAGKSATRLTLFNEIWAKKQSEVRPLVVNFVDFTAALPSLRKGAVSEDELIGEIAYLVIEQVLSWLASLTDQERAEYTEALNEDEVNLIIALLKAFYLSRPEMDRQRTMSDALRLLNRAWKTKSVLWASQRWDSLSGIVAAVIDAFTKKQAGVEVQAPVEKLLKSLAGTGGATSRTILQKLVDFVKIFPFSGIAVLVDKVDETDVTQNSADASSRLVHPILAHVQLLEVENFSWLFFLWTQIKPYFESEKFFVRLDKIPHATIEWDDKFFAEMLDSRIKYFSSGKLRFADLFQPEIDVAEATRSIISISMRSPRELVRVMDTIVVEHDMRNASNPAGSLLTQQAIEEGLDKYVKERISAVYPEKTLGQIYRLQDVVFINKDVQSAFRVNSQSARTKIKNWEDAGLVKRTGTRAPEGDQGGQPPYEYTIVDTRVERIITRRLIKLEEFTGTLPEEPEQADESAS
ncbi:P-loop ATPase, Sll1717 family [Bradyrhizobium brasilense]|uniref:P-loop ATPase, Sll1717 family n=1 Tax=Bradyrhizobium brasilense TaxID=1419277 RepID=UPI001E63B73F|nr:hypothetical protein [Bradyrhizobium brasilense]MCC8972690.1 hypothetical protein [Bradyrhizobium brasilense]